MAAELHYSNWRELSAHLIWIYQGVPIQKVGRFRKQHQTVWLLLRGQLTIQGEQPRVVESGHWIFAPHEAIVREFSEDAQILSMKFMLEWPDARMLFEHTSVLSASADAHPELERSARALLKMVKRYRLHRGNLMQFQSLAYKDYLRVQQVFNTWLIAYMDVMESLAQVPKLTRLEDARILKAQRILDQHPLSAPLDLRELAASLGLSLGHADALFSASLGQTLRGYLDHRRYRAAQHWLESTRKPMKEIAFELGFSDGSALSHWFMKKAGMAPTQFRRSKLS